jgi:hypothetical protein
MIQFKNSVPVGVGVLLGCAFAAAVPVVQAKPQAGQWACYNSAAFAAADSGAESAKTFTAGMNRIAPDAIPGTVLSIGQTVCAKH